MQQVTEAAAAPVAEGAGHGTASLAAGLSACLGGSKLPVPTGVVLHF